jgi:hypothetical protein
MVIFVTLIHSSLLARVQNFSRGRNRVVAFATIHTQSLPLPHCGIGDLPRVSAAAQNHFLYLRCVRIRPWCARPLHGIITLHVRTFLNSAPFSDIQYPHHAITIDLGQLAANVGGGKLFRPDKPTHYEFGRGSKCPMLSWLYISLSPEQPLTVVPSVACCSY